jgi:hypothetical protein
MQAEESKVFAPHEKGIRNPIGHEHNEPPASAVTVLLSSVTAPFCANALPFRIAPEAKEMDA